MAQEAVGSIPIFRPRFGYVTTAFQGRFVILMVMQPRDGEHEGEKYLDMLGLSHLAEVPIQAGDRTIQARDFLEICGDHARPMLVGFEHMNQSDPRYETTRNALRGLISKFVEPPATD